MSAHFDLPEGHWQVAERRRAGTCSGKRARGLVCCEWLSFRAWPLKEYLAPGRPGQETGVWLLFTELSAPPGHLTKSFRPLMGRSGQNSVFWNDKAWHTQRCLRLIIEVHVWTTLVQQGSALRPFPIIMPSIWQALSCPPLCWELYKCSQILRTTAWGRRYHYSHFAVGKLSYKQAGRPRL